jgi:hypothetical protein
MPVKKAHKKVAKRKTTKSKVVHKRKTTKAKVHHKKRK